MTRIGLLTTLWRREDVENIVLRHYADLDVPGVEIVRLAVGSEGAESMLRAAQNDWHYIAARNRPLSDKHNKGMDWFRDKGVAGVIVIGSDDLMTAETIRILVRHLNDGADVVAPEDIYYYDRGCDKLYYGVRHHPGAGVLYSSATLEKLNWHLWPEGIDTRLDGQAMNRVHKQGAPSRVRYLDGCRARGLVVADIKSSDNMWTLRQLKETTGRVSPVDLDIFDDAFPGVREELKALNQPTMRETSG